MRFNITLARDIKKPYLNFPVKNGVPMRRVSAAIGSGGKIAVTA